MDNKIALSYLVKLRDPHNKDLLGLSKQIWDYLQSKKITITAEYRPGHLNVTADWESHSFQDKSDWKLSPEVFAKNCWKLGTPSIDLFASRMSHQLPAYMDWKPNPGSQAINTMYQSWTKMFPYAFPSFSLIPRVLSKLRKEGTTMILVAPAWQSQAWYSVLLSMCIHNPFLVLHRKDLLLDPLGRPHPLVVNQTLRLAAWMFFEKSLASKGISDKAAKLISDSRRGSSISSYELAWRQWAGWCGKREVDPFQCPLKFILDYLPDLFGKGLEYRTINVHRSAISAYNVPLHGSPIGWSPLICSLLSGVFNLRPPQPRYPFIWDVEKVLCYLKSLPAHKNLSNKELTLKLTMMLALSATFRCSEISYLNIHFMAKTEGKYIFSFNKLTRVCCRSKSEPTLNFHEFEQDKSLCIVSLLDTYIEGSKPWKQDQQKGQLLLSFVKPHKEVLKSTISGWIKEILKQSGINVEHFKAHATRSASSSKAQMSGLPVEQILKIGNWSSKSTWQKFYNKNIEKDKIFEQAVLENVGTL